MIDIEDVAAVVVTRGDVDLTPVAASLPFPIVHVWDNATSRADYAVYGRYAALEYVDAPIVFVQDDDCILEPDSIQMLLAAYTPGKIVANMPERFRPHYPDSCLVGFGAVFDRELPAAAFARLSQHTWENYAPWSTYVEQVAPFPPQPYPDDDGLFLRTCDVVFTTLTPRVLLDVPYADREFATGPGRMYRQPAHVGDRARMLDLARKVRDAA